MLIQILCDNPSSWILPYAELLMADLKQMGHTVWLYTDAQKVMEGDILVMLSCEKIFKKLALNTHNLVVHESALPAGKGWSPLTWQVLEGKSHIPVTLIEAVEKVDAGPIYGQVLIELNGTELVEELRDKQGKATIQLIQEFVKKHPTNKGAKQEGEESFYPRRKPQDSQLDLNKTLGEQFNLLRVCDNERYPAWFEINGQKFILKIYKTE
ncbi:MAG TPA: formyltransferase family protein [Chitinophagales bacterium]|nr:formyltransferase family protein [Chitinophagales bacterium]